jgi:hypothetical protein
VIRAAVKGMSLLRGSRSVGYTLPLPHGRGSEGMFQVIKRIAGTSDREIGEETAHFAKRTSAVGIQGRTVLRNEANAEVLSAICFRKQDVREEDPNSALAAN